MAKANGVVLREIRFARQLWPEQVSKILAQQLARMIERHGLSVLSGDIQLLNVKWYVTHSGLLDLATRRRCYGIRIHPVREFCNRALGHWAFKATVFKSRTCKGFAGYGDADPSNVSLLVRSAEMVQSRNPSGQPRFARIVKSFLASVSRLASSDRCPPRFAPRRAREGTQFVDSSSGTPVSRVLRSSLSGWLVFG